MSDPDRPQRCHWKSHKVFRTRQPARKHTPRQVLYTRAGTACRRRGSTAGQCRDPGVPTNGNRDNNSNFTSGQTVRYTCMDGYQLRGAANITCQPNATWSGATPTCGGQREQAIALYSSSVAFPNRRQRAIFSLRISYPNAKPCREFQADIDECATDSGGCDQICTNLLGSYNCSCRLGFALKADGHGCEDINECATDIGGCGQICTNVLGSYTCSCLQGFALKVDGHGCEDIDECATDSGGCGQICTNLLGSYNCSCRKGFALIANGHSCEDIDECATDSGGCDQICTNVLGSYICSCRQGFALKADGHGCEDINECATDSGGCGQICTNLLGSYNCSCRQGFVMMKDAHSCEVCGHCQGGDVNCDPISGVCSAGCQAGWKTQRCTQAVDSPVNLAVTDVTEGGFNVTWSPSRDPDLQGYRVVVLRLDLTTAVNHSTDRASCMVAGLPSETDYVIEVTSLVLSEGRRSQSEEAIMRAATGARSSTDLQFVEVTDFMLVFTWVPPDAAVTGYRIMYGQEEATERLIPSPGPGARSAVITGLQPDTMYKVAITTIGVYRESSPLVGQSRTAPVPTTPSPATTTRRTSRMTTVLSTSSSSSSTPAKTSESAGDQISSDDDDAGIDSDYYYDSEPEPPIPTTESNEAATTVTSSKSPDDVRQTSSYQPVEVMTTAAVEETEEEKALDMLQSITSALDEVDMSDPATLESVGGSLLESVGALLEAPEEDAEEKPDDDGLSSAPAEDESLSPEERLQKAEQKKQENDAKRRNIVEESRRVLEKMENAMIKTLKPGDPPVSLTKGGVTLSAQKILGSEFGGQVVQTEGGCFQLPSQAALFSEFEHAPQSVTVKMKQFEQNPFTWGSGEHQVRTSVVELSLQQENNEVMTFRNLTEDFIITIPGNPNNKPATKIITIPSAGKRSARYHFYNLTTMAEGFLVTIIPLNASVVYRVSGRRGSRPDDQNYNVSMETYLLPEQCSLTKSLSGDEGDTDKTKATMFIQGEEDPGEYYVKVQVLGPVTECGFENKSDPGDARDFFAYEIQWARLKCLYWNETLEAWMTDGCAISNQSSINSTICHCNHLTAFGSDFAMPPNAMDFGKLEFSDQRCGFDNRLRGVPFGRTRNGPFASDRGIQEEGTFCGRVQDAVRDFPRESAGRPPGECDTFCGRVRYVQRESAVFARGSQVTLTFSTAEHLGTVEHKNTTTTKSWATFYHECVFVA
ncbi:hypothetical protein Bbelb_081320 [Branchiostoma belcheri]|nr:hypothetical protein Bbelb_081320 [Branchiostoma belcheri]